MTFNLSNKQVFLNDSPVGWPVVEVLDNEDYPQWPYVGFCVALENGLFAQVSFRKDEKVPYEGTPSAVNVVVGPCVWTEAFNKPEIREAILNHGKLSEAFITRQYVDCNSVQSLLNEFSKLPSPPADVMSAVKAHGFT